MEEKQDYSKKSAS
jgi:hypothetical protein